jgi:hypothetical protein
MTDQNSSAKEIADDEIPKTAKASDLSGLRASLKGYAPRPKTGETKEEFIANELSTKDVTWDEFVGSQYYKDNADLFKEMLEPKPKASEEKKEEVEIPEGTRKATKQEVDNSNAALSQPPVMDMEPEVTVLRTENTAIIVPEEQVRGQGMDIALIQPRDPPIRSKFTSDAVIRVSTRRFNHSLSLKELKFTPSTDEKRQPLMYLAWLLKALTKYDGIYVGIKNEYIDSDRVSKTRADQAGFDIENHYRNSLHAEVMGAYLEQWRRHKAPSNDVKPFLYARKVDFYGLDQEAKFISALHTLEQLNLFDVRPWHAFNRLWDSQELRLNNISENVIFQKTRVWMDAQYGNHEIMLRTNPAYRTLIADLIRQHVNVSLKVSRLEDRESLTAIFKATKFRRDTISFATGIADEVMRADGVGALRELAVLMQLSKYADADINITLTNASAADLVGCLMIKLLTPAYVWTPRARIMIDNYIAIWLLRSLPMFKGDLTISDFEFEKNHLVEMLNTPHLWNSHQHLGALRGFLLHWSDRGVPARFGLVSVNGESVDPTATNGSRTVKFWHTDFVSYSTTNEAYMVRRGQMTFEQLRAFEKFVAVIDRMGNQPRSWRFIKDELISPIQRILTEIATKADSIRELVFGFNWAARFLSLHTLTSMSKEVVEGAAYNKTTVAVLNPAAFANVMFSVDPESIQNLKFDSMMYHKAQSIHSHLSDIGDGLKIARTYLDPKIWRTSEIIVEGMKFVDPHPLKSWFQDELIKRKKTIPFKQLRPRSYLSKKLTAASTFFKSLSPSLLGFAHSFIFTNGMERAVLDDSVPAKRYRHLIKAKRLSGLPTLTIHELEALLLKGTLRDYLNQNPGPIRFRIPISLTSGPPQATPTIPLTMANLKSRLEVLNIHVGFRDGDDEVRHETDEYALLLPRTYLSETVPWIDIPADYPRSNMVHTMTVWSELDLGLPLVRMPVRSTGHL